MKIESTKVEVNANRQEVVDFLLDAQNLIHILPKEQMSDWKATENDCSFKIQGGVSISLIHDGRKENDEIYMRSGKGTPFAFKLIIHLKDNGATTGGYIEFDGEVNMFLRMMVEKPLTALFNLMSERLKSHFEG